MNGGLQLGAGLAEWLLSIRSTLQSARQSRSSSAISTDHQTAAMKKLYSAAFGVLRRQEQLDAMLGSSRSAIVVGMSGVNARLLVNHNSVLVQRRGFRTKRGLKQDKVQDGQEQTFVNSLLANLGIRPSATQAGQERLSTVIGQLDKMSDQQKDGFIRGMVAQNSMQPGSGATASKTRRRALWLAILSLFAFLFLSGLVSVTVSDKDFGSFFLTSPKMVSPEDVNVTFADVKGADEAKNELTEIVDYLKDPEHYSRLGGRLPKGVILVGPPGTGKTLLARAVAGEAGVPFFHASGSEFDEMLVGQGARRVRDLFTRASQQAPCIIFIDEVDSVGAKRVNSSLHPYANQTINQLLAEMDGFETNNGVIVLAATNRIEDLDKALLRPGRFDVRVNVPTPDLAGRKEIFDYYLERIVHDPRISAELLAKGTTGFTGADIENMVNQAALKAASDGHQHVLIRHLDDARDRVLMGPARAAGRLPDEETNKSTAYHEAGHTLVALLTKDATPLHKVTIIPRGSSLGHTAMLADKDAWQLTRSQLLAQLDVCMGGRVAEELIFGQDKVTTGASDDLKRATVLATSMVKKLGMSEKVGLRDYTVEEESAMLPYAPGRVEVSPQMAQLIDEEIDRLLNESFARVKDLLTKNKKEHRLLAEALLEYETLSADEVRDVCAGKHPTRPATQHSPAGGGGGGSGNKRGGGARAQNPLHVLVQPPTTSAS